MGLLWTYVPNRILFLTETLITGILIHEIPCLEFQDLSWYWSPWCSPLSSCGTRGLRRVPYCGYGWICWTIFGSNFWTCSWRVRAAQHFFSTLSLLLQGSFRWISDTGCTAPASRPVNEMCSGPLSSTETIGDKCALSLLLTPSSSSSERLCFSEGRFKAQAVELHPRHQLFDRTGWWVAFSAHFLEAGLLYSSRCKERQGSDSTALWQRLSFIVRSLRFLISELPMHFTLSSPYTRKKETGSIHSLGLVPKSFHYS